MCRAVECATCGKTTWAGCGKHIDTVRAGVPAARWCPGHESKTATQSGGFFARLLRRG